MRLARRLLAGRSTRASLGALAHFFGTAADPCHRALRRGGDGRDPARAARGSRRSAARNDGRPRRALGAAGAPARRQALARGGRAGAARRLPLPRPQRAGALRRRAGDLRARLRSYFAGGRQRPAVEGHSARSSGSNGVCSAPSWRRSRSCACCGSCARLPTPARPRPDRYVYLRRRRPASWRARRRGRSGRSAAAGSPAGRPRARRSCRGRPRRRPAAAAGAPAAARLDLRFEDAARLRRPRGRSSKQVVGALASSSACAARGVRPRSSGRGGIRARFFVAGGRVAAARTSSRPRRGSVEIEAAGTRAG